jgi:hypothetical protein
MIKEGDNHAIHCGGNLFMKSSTASIFSLAVMLKRAK